MPILNYTTTIAVSKTTGEIQEMLARRGATRVSTVYDGDGNPEGIAFTMRTDYGVREFSLPVRVDGVLAAMVADPKVPRSQCTRQQAGRVAWRIAKDWLAAQAALIDAGLARTDEVMMPYMVAGDGQTMYELMRESALKSVES